MPALLRKMTLADVPVVHAIEKRVQAHPWSLQLFHDSVTAPHQCTVLELDDLELDDKVRTVVGFCILQPVLDEANLLLMAIDPDYQQQGFGQQLLQQSIDALTDCNMIFLEVRQSNQAAIALYEKLGFAQIDLRKNYYPSNSPNNSEGSKGKEHAVIMALTLSLSFS